MTRHSLKQLIKIVDLLNHKVPRLDNDELKRFVKSLIERRNEFLALPDTNNSPLYVIDNEALLKNAERFRAAFSSALPDIRIYYALKSNSHPLIVSSLVECGFGIDVSSGIELRLALASGARDIIFSGPGKLQNELAFAVDNYRRVTVLLDSFGELQRLEDVAARSKTRIRAGIRLTTDGTGIWKKFGIPLDHLQEFFAKAEKCEWIDLCGLQFHISWNLNPESQVMFIAQLGAVLRNLDKKYYGKINFIDIGGGFWPEEGEWLQAAATPQGILHSVIDDSIIRSKEHYKKDACSIDVFASRISGALKRHLLNDSITTVCLEPGRWICNNAMHLILKVIDRKSSDVVITDGGTNAVGWERFETDYFPVINLTRPGLNEHECLIAGSLCTPHDIWGYSYFGENITEGDILLVPNQGAYTYSLRQEFIKPLPKCASLAMPSTKDKIEFNLINQ